MRLAAILAAAGCQLVNEPDLSFLDDPPGGDADTDSDTDTGTDSGTDPCAGVECGANEHCDDLGGGGCVCDEGFRRVDGVCEAIPIEDCAAAGDEDADGFSNCADFDCIGTTACCGEAPDPAVDASFAASIDTGLWTAFLAGQSPTVAGGGLDFADRAEGNGLFYNQPVDISGGLELEISGLTGGASPCESVAGCADYAGVALTRVITFVEGVPLPTSLSVLVTAGGGVLVTRGGVVRGRGAVEAGPFDLRVRVTPAVSAGGENGFAVVVTDEEDDGRTVWASVDPVLDPLDNLRIDRSVGATLAVVGRTSDDGNAKLSTLVATPLSCANPSGWTLLTSATRTTIGIETAEWATGGFGAPTAIGANEVGDEGMRVLFDASNLDPFFEIYGDVNKAIGETALWLDADTWVWEPGALVIGEVEPNCVDGDCTPSDSQPDDARGPSGFRNPGGTFAFVIEEQGGVIRLYDRSGSPWRLRGDSPLWRASEHGFERWVGVAAVSRQLEVEDLCAFALGEDGLGVASLVILCAPDVAALADGEFDPDPLWTSAAFWPLAARGMSGLAVVWDDGSAEAGDEAFRVWTVGTDADRGTGLLHAAIGPRPDVDRVVQPYAGNPVLRGDSEFLGGCDGQCALGGVGVVEIGELRRVVVGRQEDGDVTDFEIFALEQNR